MKWYIVLHRTLVKGDYKNEGDRVQLTTDEAKPLEEGELIMEEDAYLKAQAAKSKKSKG